jgi:predicted nuclease of predicted toxin-antitoxin system
VRFLLDENISPALAAYLAAVGVFASSVPHVGLAGRSDHEIWRYALKYDFAVVTMNARDFIALLGGEIHPGLIVLQESGLSREEQWQRLRPVVDFLRSEAPDFLLNKLIEIRGAGEFEVRDLPSA